MQAGYKVFRLHQPRFAPQGEIDAIAIGHGRIRFVQFRTNQWHDLRPLKAFAEMYCHGRLLPTAECWLYRDGNWMAQQRIME